MCFTCFADCRFSYKLGRQLSYKLLFYCYMPTNHTLLSFNSNLFCMPSRINANTNILYVSLISQYQLI